MMQNSYIMMKPDAMEVQTIHNYIKKLLETHKLEVTKQAYVKISPQKIAQIWPNTLKDPIRFFLQVLYLGQSDMKILEVKGENAIEIVDLIKKNVRKKYGRDLLVNCLHAPTNEKEYLNDMKYLYSRSEKKDIRFESQINKSINTRYSALRNDDFWYTAICLWNVLDKCSIEDLNDMILSTAKQYGCVCVFLKNDNHNQLSYVVATLFEYFQERSLGQVYLGVLAASQIDKFPVFLSKSLEKCKKIISHFEKRNIVMEYQIY